jgi:hypothetical protein
MKTKKKLTILTILIICITININAKSFDDIYPAMDSKTRASVFSDTGFTTTVENGMDITIESTFVIQSSSNSIDILKVYNTLANVSNLKGRTYYSFTRKKEIALFEEASRVESEKKNNTVQKWSIAKTAPQSDTIFLRLKDANFGNTYYRADIETSANKLSCTLANFKNITFIIFSVIKERNMVCSMNFELIDEGLLFTCTSNIHVENFAGQNIDVPSAIQKRLSVITEWICDGIRN